MIEKGDLDALMEEREKNAREKKAAYDHLYLVLPDTAESRAELEQIWASAQRRLTEAAANAPSCAF